MAAYHRPETLEAALDLLAAAPVTIAAGCTDLFAATPARVLPGEVLDITGIVGLRGIGRTDTGLRIGAATTWSDVVRADLPPAFDVLKQAAREVGSVQIQNAGTVAGNICNASPAADGMPCLLALDAEVELASATGRRRLPLADFVTGPRKTALGKGEMVIAVHVPHAAMRGKSRFEKLGAREYLVISIAMVAARLELDGGTVERASIAVGSCGPVAVRLGALEAALTGAPLLGLGARVEPELVARHLSPIDDIRADSGYRARAATELVRRALEGLAGGCGEAAA